MGVLTEIVNRTGDLPWRLAGAHAWIYRTSGGRVGRRIPGVRAPMLLLTHVGAKSGTERQLVLMYVDADDDDVAIVASKGGNARHPAWYHNLRANPETTVIIGHDKRNVRAREASGEERERLYERANEAWGGFDEYADRTERTIPVIVLERI